MRRVLILWNAVALLGLFAVLGVTVRGIVRAGMYAAIDRELATRLERFIERPPKPERDEPRGRGGGRGNPYKPHRFDLDGRSVVPPGQAPLWDADAFRRCQTEGALTTTVQRDGEPLRVLSMPVREGGALAGVAQIPYPVAEVARAGVLLDRALLALVPLVLLAAWGGAALLTVRVLRPVNQITEAAGKLEASDLSQRLTVSGKDEFARLATTFNGMLERLETAFDRQRRFTADASHELKTPLTRIKGTASMALLGPQTPERLGAALTEIDRAADTMSELTRDLLLLAKGDAGRLGEKRAAVPAAALLERARERVARPDAAPISLSVEPDGLTFFANEAELLRLLVNLLQNALQNTPPDGQVSVAARSGELRVTDTGAGIAAEHLLRLGERFYRPDDARNRKDGGTGLGLAICKSIVEAHGGSLTYSSELGKGTTVKALIPRQLE